MSFYPDDDVLLERDLVRVPRRFIKYRLSVGLPVPAVVLETDRRGFGSYYFRRDDPVLIDVIRDATRWIEPGGPFRRGDIVKAARWFLAAIVKSGLDIAVNGEASTVNQQELS